MAPSPRENTEAQNFEDMTPGTVFTFNQPSFGPAFFVWDGHQGIELDERQSAELVRMEHSQRLSSLPHGSRTTRSFGEAASSDINKDFSRVSILGEAKKAA